MHLECKILTPRITSQEVQLEQICGHMPTLSFCSCCQKQKNDLRDEGCCNNAKEMELATVMDLGELH